MSWSISWISGQKCREILQHWAKSQCHNSTENCYLLLLLIFWYHDRSYRYHTGLKINRSRAQLSPTALSDKPLKHMRLCTVVSCEVNRHTMQSTFSVPMVLPVNRLESSWGPELGPLSLEGIYSFLPLFVTVWLIQVGKSSQNFSMLSLKDSNILASSNFSVAVYKGVTVSVYDVDKQEITLTRQDLIDLVNVSLLSNAISK